MSPPSDRDNELLAKFVVEGLLKFTLPAILVATAGTYYMRRRASSLMATPAERWILTGMHYYAGANLGASLGMWLYQPIFERKVLEQTPNSDLAKAIRESKRRHG
ncbi:hypothetical protein PoB_000193800 [Plakobranchus ocellatus]|uniref:Uncharacterized protein n=1 Tax=Plakobranchus ocellatus TaxID=259542 RepID=A0AAV3XZ02_9GAST|nr:hypothetical protein PoB_000193800 [Plakobranchus ocellatus]